MSRHTVTVTCEHGGGGGGLGLPLAILAGVALLGSGAVAAVVSAVVTILAIVAAAVVGLAAAVTTVVVVRRRRRGWRSRSALVAPYWRPPVGGPDTEGPRELPVARMIPGRVLPPGRPVCQARPRDRRGRRG